MYYILNDTIYPGVAVLTLKQLLQIDKGEKSLFVDQTSTFENQSEPPLKRKGDIQFLILLLKYCSNHLEYPRQKCRTAQILTDHYTHYLLNKC